MQSDTQSDMHEQLLEGSDACEYGSDGEGAAPAGRASLQSCIINLTNTCMGTGILALPYAFRVAGLTAGSLLCVASAAMGVLSLRFLDLAASAYGIKQPTFYKLCEAAYPGAGLVIDVAVVVNCFGTAASYLIVATDSFSEGLSGLRLERWAWTCLSVLIVAPLCYLRSMHALRHSSLLSVCVLLGIVALVLAFAVVPGLEPCGEGQPAASCRGGVERLSGPPLRVFLTLPIFISAFTCQQNVRAHTRGAPATIRRTRRPPPPPPPSDPLSPGRRLTRRDATRSSSLSCPSSSGPPPAASSRSASWLSLSPTSCTSSSAARAI